MEQSVTHRLRAPREAYVEHTKSRERHPPFCILLWSMILAQPRTRPAACHALLYPPSPPKRARKKLFLKVVFVQQYNRSSCFVHQVYQKSTLECAGIKI